MARMNEVFMKGVALKMLEIFQRTKLTKIQFCERLQISGAYLSNLQNEKSWPKIPAWVWYLFRNVVNRMIEFNSRGEIIYVYNGYTLEEVIEECKAEAEKFEKSHEEFDPGIIKEHGKEKLDLEEFELKKLTPDEKSVRLSEAMISFMDYMTEFSERFVEFMIKTKEDEVKELKKIREFLKKCKI